MNTEPPTGDDLNRMLVSMKQNVLERTTETAPRRRHRHAGITLGVIALLGIGGASGALALGWVPSPFAAQPVATQSASPSPTATLPAPPQAESQPTEQEPAAPIADSEPGTTVPTDCSTLGDAGGVASLVPDPSTVTSTGQESPRNAGLRQAGVLSCRWFSGSERSLLFVDIATDTTQAAEWIDARLAAGESPFGVGDRSVVGCNIVTVGCSASVLAGEYWIEFAFQGTADDANADQLVPIARSMVASLIGLAPGDPWQVPETSWSSMTDCSAMQTTVPMSEVLNSPGMTGPQEMHPGAFNGIERTLSGGYSCYWSVPDEQGTPPEQARVVQASITPGAGWAYGWDEGYGTEVEVTGAERATIVCNQVEGQECWIEVLTDDSWLNVRFGYSAPMQNQQETLIRAAEAILSGHTAR